MKGSGTMEKNNLWLPIIASLGVGAATFYTMSRNNQTIGQTIQKVVPFVTQMSNTNGNTEQLGPHGMS
ncbi:hypothetical protein AB4Y30_11720 [Ornithinibacillus sp. 4-3]|uniref:Uncharacterized protein n=1 Tax=Ornithinibacillus sp. 4-3 TaxID=3231488 RepID=A0AB39HPG2_9BACI